MIDFPLDDDPPRSPTALPAAEGNAFYQGTIVRLYYGSGTGVIRSTSTGREYRFRFPFVEVRGGIPRIEGLREGMTVGFDLAWTSAGQRISVIRLPD